MYKRQVSGRILTYVAILVVMYIISLIAGAFYTQMMAIITQGSLKKMREKMFSHMQDLPIKYFDTNGHGDIMSYYTNDVDKMCIRDRRRSAHYTSPLTAAAPRSH